MKNFFVSLLALVFSIPSLSMASEIDSILEHLEKNPQEENASLVQNFVYEWNQKHKLFYLEPLVNLSNHQTISTPVAKCVFKQLKEFEQIKLPVKKEVSTPKIFSLRIQLHNDGEDIGLELPSELRGFYILDNDSLPIQAELNLWSVLTLDKEGNCKPVQKKEIEQGLAKSLEESYKDLNEAVALESCSDPAVLCLKNYEDKKNAADPQEEDFDSEDETEEFVQDAS